MIVMKPTIRALMAALALSAVPTTALADSGTVLRTPDARFAGLPDYPFEPRYLEVPFGDRKVRMHYIDVGPRTGPVVLLLHGQPSWSYMYRGLVAALAQRGYRAIAPDLIGFGRSDKPVAMDDYTYARHLEALAAFVRTLDLRRIDLVAHDWGGLLGMPTVAAMPDRFNRLVLLDTSLSDGTDPESPSYSAGFDRWIELLRTAPIVAVDQVIEAQTESELPQAVRDAYMAPFPDGSYQSGVRRITALIPRRPGDVRARENGLVRQFFAGWDRPVFIAFSAQSDRLHPGQFERFRSLFPARSIWAAVQVPGTRHFLLEDRPDEISRWVLAFLGGEPPPTATPPTASAAASTAVATAATATATAGACRPQGISGDALQADVARYVSLGEGRTGSAASKRGFEWIDRRLIDAGYRTRAIATPVDLQEPERVELDVGTQRITDGFPLWPVAWTGRDGVQARLCAVTDADCGAGDIIYLRLPFNAFSSAFHPDYRAALQEVLRRRPAAAVAIVDHPSGEVVALNVRGAEEEGTPPARRFPFLVLGQKHESVLQAAAASRQTVRLTMTGKTTPSSDLTLIAESGSPGQKALVITTPRNGWFFSGGERGPGIAVALALAEWLRRHRPEIPVRLAFTSHHELGGAGMKKVLADPEFAVDRVTLWMHLGANIATREAVVRDGRFGFTPGPNAQRGIGVTPALFPELQRAFAGRDPIRIDSLADARPVGEMALIARGGAYPLVGVVGYQLAHHTRLDTADSTSPQVLGPMAEALACFIDGLR